MEQDFLAKRKLVMARQLQRGGISDRRVLEAFVSIPRHLFVPDEYRSMAYDNCPLPIGFKQTISQPFIAAYMTQSLALTGTERVLEVGTGSGYQATILSQLAAEVHTVELIPNLAECAKRTLDKLGITNVSVHVGDGSQGWDESAPYDAIIVTAGGPRVPKSLLTQLADGGRMIMPVGEHGYQILELWYRDGDDFSYESLLPVTFVPLIGEEEE